MSLIDKEIGLRLKIGRKAAGFKTAFDFSIQMKIPKSTYSQHENGKRSLTAEHIINYANKLEIEASWLLTGFGHPCPQTKNKNQKKEIIDSEIIKLQELNLLPHLKNPLIEINDNSAIVNMELFTKIIISAVTALTSKNLPIHPEELISFCVDVYNNIEFLEINSGEKNKIIDLSISSMLRGSNVTSIKAINQ